ncbi:MAG: hypothetical protein ABF608_12500 [Sporolactobacillus sp.]
MRNKRAFMLVAVAMIVCILTGCTHFHTQKNSTVLLRYTNESGQVITIDNEQKIHQLKTILDRIKWSKNTFKRPSGYYSIWIEKGRPKSRILNYRIWINADSNDFTKDDAKIFDPQHDSYGHLNTQATHKLKAILHW